MKKLSFFMFLQLINERNNFSYDWPYESCQNDQPKCPVYFSKFSYNFVGLLPNKNP